MLVVTVDRPRFRFSATGDAAGRCPETARVCRAGCVATAGAGTNSNFCSLVSSIGQPIIPQTKSCLSCCKKRRGTNIVGSWSCVGVRSSVRSSNPTGPVYCCFSAYVRIYFLLISKNGLAGGGSLVNSEGASTRGTRNCVGPMGRIGPRVAD